jgi:predicted P-loop ATPase
VARVFEPGVKFDTMTVLVGGQGIGKSTILKMMGGEWFSDSLTLSDMKDKNGVEKLNGAWISEIAELSGMRKTDSETIKGFITRRDDRMRPAYGHTVVSKPRQGIFVGTTNELEGFLRDLTGNRRYWPIIVNGYSDYPPEKWDLIPETIGQIWAEATEAYKAKETLYLPKWLQDLMTMRQEGLLEADARMGAVQRYLDMRLPREWDKMNLSDRLDFIRGTAFPKYQAVAVRNEVSTAEIWCECFEENISRLGRRESNEIVAMLIKLGWKRSDKIRRTALYGVQRYFIRPVRNDQELEVLEDKKDEFEELEDLIAIEEMLQ